MVIDAGKTDYRAKILGEIETYNSALPPQVDIDEYNTQYTRFINMTENKHKVNLCVENTGTTSANQVMVTLHFPPQLLVFDDMDIEDTEEPKKPKLPKNPLNAYDGKNTTKLFSNLTGFVGMECQQSFHKIPILSNRLLSNIPNNYYTDGEDWLCYENEKILHTTAGHSHDFYIVATQKGTFEIKGEIICEEIPTSIIKHFTVTVE